MECIKIYTYRYILLSNVKGTPANPKRSSGPSRPRAMYRAVLVKEISDHHQQWVPALLRRALRSKSRPTHYVYEKGRGGQSPKHLCTPPPL